MTKERSSTGKKPDAPAADNGINVSASQLSPWQIIQHYDDKTWERFIEEWTEGFDPPYAQVVPLGGAGDKGRDLVAYAGDPSFAGTPWDSYQCKHYNGLLTPTDVYIELAKLCYYTLRGDYTIPRKYYFVSPKGVGTKLHDMLKRPDVLKAALIANWDGYCRRDIQTDEVVLTDALRFFIESFDFSIVWFLTPQQILTQHRRTKYWHHRFKIDPPSRPVVPVPPDDVQSHELRYVAQLLAAYSDHSKRDVKTPQALSTNPNLMQHFKRSRGYFYSAEALARFSRDHFQQGAFDAIKQHVFDGVADISASGHDDGYRCVLAVTGAAAQLPLPQSDLQPYVGPADKKGICHHLANDGDLTWVSI
jgi:hypothetical protein